MVKNPGVWVGGGALTGAVIGALVARQNPALGILLGALVGAVAVPAVAFPASAYTIMATEEDWE
jgi:uncharacterized protein YqgC (DUF456 family)